MYLKKCLECKRDFDSLDHRQKFCSRSCGCKASRRNKKKKDKNKICKQCNKNFNYNQSSQLFCSQSCSATFNNTGKCKVKRGKCLLCGKDLISSQKFYCSNQCQRNYIFKDITKQIESGIQFTSRVMKRYLINKFGEKCLNKDCGWDWNKPSIIELEHKDGNSENNSLENLTLLCPNCHAMTPTYKNKNKGHGRFYRRERYKEGKSY